MDAARFDPPYGIDVDFDDAGDEEEDDDEDALEEAHLSPTQHSMVSGLWVRPLLGLFFGTAASNTRLVMISEMIIEKNSHSIIMEPLFTSFCIDF